MNLKFNHPQPMKKFLLTMAIALLGFAIPGRGAELKYDLDFKTATYPNNSAYTGTWTAEYGDMSWSVSGCNNNNNSWKYVKAGAKTTTQTSSISTTKASDFLIEEIVINAKKLVSSATITGKLYVYRENPTTSSSYISVQNIPEISTTESNTSIFLSTGGKGYYYKIEFSINNTTSTNGALQINSIKYYGSNETVTPPSGPTKITFTPSGGNITTTTPISLSSDGPTGTTIEYAIDKNDSYNTYSGQFFLGVGSHIIYAKASYGSISVENSASYTVTDSSQGGGDTGEEGEGEGEGELSSYTILFKTASSNNSNSQFSTSSQPSAVLEDGSDYVKTFTAVTLSYPEGVGGARIGQNSNDGKLSFDLTEKGQVVPTKIVCLISANKASTKMKINGNEYTVSSAYSNENYVPCELPVYNDILKSFTIEKTGNNIGYIRSITVYYKNSNGDDSDPTPKEYTALDQYDDTEDITFKIGSYYQLDLGDEHPDITWEYDPEGIITIDTNGKITATSAGEVFVTGNWGDDKTWTKGEVNFLVTVTENQGGEIIPPTPGEDLSDSAWVKVTTDDQLVINGKYIIATSGTFGKNSYNVAMGFVTGTNTYLNCPTVKFSDNGNEIVFSETENKGIINDVAVISFDGTSLDAAALALYTLSGESKGYYKASEDKKATISISRYSEAKISLGTNGKIEIDFDKGGSSKLGRLYYNGNSPRFANYTNAQEAIYLYKLKEPEKTPEFPVVKIGEETLENNGRKTVAKGTEITISSENAKTIKVQLGDGEATEISSNLPTYSVTESGTYTIWGVNGRQEGDKFTYTFTIGEIDPNMPAVGSNFRQVKSTDEIKEGYYVIARPDNSKSMSKVPDTSKNVRIATTDVSVESIDTGSKTFNLLTTSPNALIVYIEEKEEGKYGIKTVNYDDGFLTSQGYLANPTGNNLDVVEDFTPVYFSITTSYNTDIKFAEDGNKITITNGNYFNLASSGNTVQLFKYTTAKKFEPDFENPLAIPQGRSLQMKPKNESYPEISYRVKRTTTIISIEKGSDEVQSNPDRTSDELKEHPYVVASWDESNEWFAGETEFQVIVKYYLNAKQFGFEYDVIRGKKDVGVAAQAARYLGTGKVEYRVYDVYDIETQTFVETPETELRINHETGMIRPEDIVNAKLNKDYIVVATVDETDEHMPAYRSYIIRIEDFTPPTVSNKATFIFNGTGDDENKYGMYPFEGSTTQSGTLQFVYELDMPTAGKDHVGVKQIEENGIVLDFEGAYRYMKDSQQIRLYAGSKASNDTHKAAELTFSVPEGYSISSIEFSSPNSTAVDNNFTTSISSKDNIWSEDNSKWNAPYGGINKLTFTAKATIRISQITVTIDAPNHGEKTLSTLSFPEDARLYNIFVGETETISGLTSSAVPFELIEYDIDNVEGINGNLDEDDYEQDPFTNYVINPKWNDEKSAVDIDVTVNTPGIYTFRAYNESDDQYYAGMAILRLNVFPRFEVRPGEGSDLADDERTKHPQLTLVNHDEDEKATIKLPNLSSLNNDYKYSTVTLNVEVKHGDDNYKYSSLDEESIPESFVFKQDGYVKYEMLYANTDDFKKEETVHVVLMPSWNFTADSNSITIIPTANSTLQYCYFQTRYYDKDGRKPGEFVESTKKGVKARATTEEKVNDWVTTNEATTFSVDDSGFEHTDGYWIGVKYRTVKNVNDITGLGLVDPILASDYNTILFTDAGIPTGIDDINTDFSDFESEGEAVYFNLQGQKVNKPERGVYIIVKDGKAEKVIF